MFLFNQLFQFHSHVLFKVVLKNASFSYRGGGVGGGEGDFPYLTDAGDA